MSTVLGIVAQIVLIAVPYVLASLGGSITERSGIIDLAIEGKMLFGAFAAAAVGIATGSAWLGLAGGMLAGVLVALVQVGWSLWLAADQVIVGIGLNLLALGGTRFLLQALYGESTSSPAAPAFGDAVVTSPVVWLTVIAAVAVPLAVRRTRWGLRLRAAGDRPDALIAAGESPARARFAAAAVGGALSGAGGAQLALAVGGFSAEMTTGRGYIALAMIILAGWRPAFAALAALGVAVALAVNFVLQIGGNTVLRGIGPILPYLLTLAVLVIWGGRRSQPPQSLGKV